MTNKQPQRMQDIPLTPANYAIVDSYARDIVGRGGTVPQHVAGWLRSAEATYNGMSPADQARVVGELQTARQHVAAYHAADGARTGYSEGDQYLRDASRGIGGQFDGADAAKLREISENKPTYKTVNKPVLSRQSGGRYEKQTIKETKYTDSESRRAALVLAFGKADAERAANGADAYGPLGRDIDPAYRNSGCERTRDVCEAWDQINAASAGGHALPTTNYEPATSGVAPTE